MPLFLADIHLYRARLFGARNGERGARSKGPGAGSGGVVSDQSSVVSGEKYPWTSPQADLAEAQRLITKHGYLRRMEELEDAERAILGALPT